MTLPYPTHRVPEVSCPVCGKKLDSSSSLETSNAPREGDVTVCVYCAGVLTFDAGLRLQKVPPDDDIHTDPRIKLLRTLILETANDRG